MIEYKGYIGFVDFDPEIDLFHGMVIRTQDIITIGVNLAIFHDFLEQLYKHAALTGLGSFFATRCYKHAVPTGLKRFF